MAIYNYYNVVIVIINVFTPNWVDIHQFKIGALIYN